jgi:hypothetical protein
MKLNPEIVRHAYASLSCAYPFTKWNMPLPEEVLFEIIYDMDALGTYTYDTGHDEYEHTITISSARCAFYMTMLSTLAHEMVHCSFHRQKGDKWLHHGKEFRRRCTLVGKSLGLDHLEL